LETNTRILKAARKVLARDGIERLSTRAVCKEAKITSPTLYHHFNDKASLLNALVELAYEEFLRHKTKAPPVPDPFDDLKVGWTNYVEFALKNPDLFIVLCESWRRGVIPGSFKIGNDLLIEKCRRAIDAGRVHSTDVETVSQILWSSAHGVAFLMATRPDFPWAKGFVESAREAVFLGLARS
jgi:AcrR family transcriptional regulator